MPSLSTPAADAACWNAAFEQHPLPHLVFLSGSLHIVAVNAAAVQRYGWPREVLLTMTREDLLHPEERPHLRDFLAALADRPPSQRTSMERDAQGRTLWADVVGQPIDWHGQAARLIVVMEAGPRAQLQARAQQAGEMLAVAGRMARLGSWWLDLRQGVSYPSDLACELHEIPSGSELKLDDAVAFYPEDVRPGLSAAVQRCIEQGEPFDLELPFVGARGTRRWVRSAGEPVRDLAGEVIALRGAMQDITALHADRQALAESREQLAALLAALPDLWIVCDEALCVQQAHVPAGGAPALPWAVAQGRRLHELLPPPLLAEVRERIAAAHARHRPAAHPHELVLPDGSRRACEARYVPLTGARTLVLVRDITETVQLEQRFQAMADAAPIGIFTTDDRGLVTYTNPAWQALFGLTPERALGEGWALVMDPADVPRIGGQWRDCVAAHRHFEAEFRVPGGGGEWRTLWAQARPVLRADGTLTGMVGAVVDVTQARELARARQAQAVAEEAGRRQTAFLSRVSHELRTPLNAILGFGELLHQQFLPQGGRTAAYLGHVMEAGRHMLALVDDLLQLQRIEQGLVEPTLEPVSVDTLLQACQQMMVPMAQEGGVTLAPLVPCGLSVVTDERMVRQIVLNLGANAIRHGGRGCSLSLAAGAVDGALELRVVDTGRGIAAADLERLFRPFERLGQERRGVAGTGLGLVISRQLARALGGELYLDSAAGQGTTARLRLPLPAPQRPTAEQPNPQPHPHPHLQPQPLPR